MKFILIVLAVLVAAPTFAQVKPNPITNKPMPTLAQCHADLDAWTATIDPETDGESMLTVDDLMQMSLEMSRCDFAMDKQNHDKYLKIEERIQTCISGRYYDFIRRHPMLWEQFIKEDAAGQR